MSISLRKGFLFLVIVCSAAFLIFEKDSRAYDERDAEIQILSSGFSSVFATQSMIIDAIKDLEKILDFDETREENEQFSLESKAVLRASIALGEKTLEAIEDLRELYAAALQESPSLVLFERIHDQTEKCNSLIREAFLTLQQSPQVMKKS